jgi:hypothetical protein
MELLHQGCLLGWCAAIAAVSNPSPRIFDLEVALELLPIPSYSIRSAATLTHSQLLPRWRQMIESHVLVVNHDRYVLNYEIRFSFWFNGLEWGR